MGSGLLGVAQIQESNESNNMISTGNITTSTPGVGNTVSIAMRGKSSSAFTLTGTWQGTLVVEGTVDGTNWSQVWFGCPCSNPVFSGITTPQFSIVSTLAANINGTFKILNTTGSTQLRVRATTDTVWGGTAVITMSAVLSPPTHIYTNSSVIQNVVADANNSSTTNLTASPTAGYIYAGVATTTLGIVGIQVSLKTDQNCLVYIDQSPGIGTGVGTVTTNGTTTLAGASTKFTRDFKVGDQIWVSGETVRTITAIASDISLTVGVAFATSAGGLSFTQYFWDISDVYNYYSATNNFGVTVQAVNSYVRVRVINQTASPTTYFRLQTALCPIVEAVPRSLSSEGNLKTAMAEDIAYVSTLNSTGNIGAGATYTGTFELIVNQSAIQFIALYDQYTIIRVDQSIDGTNVTISDTFYGAPNTGIAETITSVAPYYRIRVSNQNGATQATGSIVSAKTVILNALPRTVDQNGNLKLGNPQDLLTFRQYNTPQGEVRNATSYKLVGKQFDFVGNGGAVDTNFWTPTVDGGAGTGSVVMNESVCELHSGTGATAYSQLNSFRRARYVGAHANRYRANIIVPTTQTNNTKRWGIGMTANYTFTISSSNVTAGDVYGAPHLGPFTSYFTVMISGTGITTLYTNGIINPAASGTLDKVSGAAGSSATIAYSAFATKPVVMSDGAWFKLSGSTFSLEVSKGGNVTPITVFNGDYGSTYTVDTNSHTYEIYWINSKIYFVIDGMLLHIYSASTTSWADTLHMYIIADNVNSGNTTDTLLSIRNSVIHRLGGIEAEAIWKNIHGVNAGTTLKYGPGKLYRLMINTSVAGSVISIYDSSYGAVNPIALINPANDVTIVCEYDLVFYNGLYIVTANASTDVTIVYD